MTFYLPKPDKFYKLQSPWTFQITLDSRNREIYEKLTGEEAGYSKFYRLRREDAEPPECTLPEDTVIEIDRYETKESHDGSHGRTVFFKLRSDHPDFDTSSGDPGKSHVRVGVLFGEMDGVEAEQIDFSESQPPEVKFEHSGWHRSSGTAEVNGEVRFRYEARTEDYEVTDEREVIVPREGSDYESLEGFVHDHKGALEEGTEDFTVPAGAAGMGSIALNLIRHSILGGNENSPIARGYLDHFNGLEGMMDAAHENFTIKTNTNKRSRTRQVWDLYDVQKDETVYEGYTNFNSLTARARKIIKQEHEQE